MHRAIVFARVSLPRGTDDGVAEPADAGSQAERLYEFTSGQRHAAHHNRSRNIRRSLRGQPCHDRRMGTAEETERSLIGWTQVDLRPARVQPAHRHPRRRHDRRRVPDRMAVDHRRHLQLREARATSAAPGSSPISAGRSARSGSACCGWRSAWLCDGHAGHRPIIAWLPLAVVSIWFVYRIVRGWLGLRDRKPMYV